MYSAIDAARIVLAVLAYVPLAILPGYAVGSLTDALGWRLASKGDRWLLALVLGLATLPGLESVTVRLLGLTAGLALVVALAGLGLFLCLRRRDWLGLRWAWLAALALWLAVVMFDLIDFDFGGQLRQSIVVLDLVKHAATIQAIATHGAPPIDPFFFRSERSGYYYFFYTTPAILTRFSGGLIDARAAFSGLAFWTGPGLFGLAAMLLDRTGLANDENRGRLRWLVFALLSCTGLAIVGVILFRCLNGHWPQEIDWWNEEVKTWNRALVWIPHHVTALIASWVGLAVLAGEADRPSPAPKGRAGAVVLAAVCFASSFGASVWVTLVTFLAIVRWSASLAVRRRWVVLGLISCAGGVALIMDAPAIFDLIHNRGDDGFPVIPMFRMFLPWDMVAGPEPMRTIGDILLLPVNYGLEFGVFALGTWMFWRRRRMAEVHATEISRLLTIGAVVGLLVGTCLRSTVIFNDLGWRSMLFPQLASLIWTAVALGEASKRTASGGQRRSPWVPVLLALGYAGVVYGLVCPRLPSAWFEPLRRYVNAQPAVDRDLRGAFEWANTHLSPGWVLQQNPTPDRVVAFGLYGHNRVAVADWQAMLFGAPKSQVLARVGLLSPLFQRGANLAQARSVALQTGVDALIVTSADAVWDDRTSWVWSAPTLYQNVHVRIIAAQALGEQPPSRTH